MLASGATSNAFTGAAGETFAAAGLAVAFGAAGETFGAAGPALAVGAVLAAGEPAAAAGEAVADGAGAGIPINCLCKALSLEPC